jgi:hypothetical protein
MSITSILLAQWPPSPQQWAILAGLAAFVLLTTVLALRRKSDESSTRHHRRELDAANRQAVGIKQDMAELLSELQALSERIDRQLDDKCGELRGTIEEADRRIASLSELIGSWQRAGGAVTTPDQAPALRGRSAMVDSPPQPDPVPTPVEEPIADPFPATVENAGSDPDVRAGRIHRLADQGLTAPEIARRLEEPLGEVELILNLRNACDRPRA